MNKVRRRSRPDQRAGASRQLDATDQAVLVVDRDGRVSRCNRSAERLFGWPPGGGSKRLLADLVPPPLPADGVEAIWSRVLEDGAWAGDYPVRRADGSSFIASAAVSPCETPGADGSFVIVVSDVTEGRHLAQAAQRESVIGLALDGIVTYWSAGAERLFGYSRQEMCGRPLSTLFPPDRQAEAAGALRRISLDSLVPGHETIQRRRDGMLVSVVSTYAPVHDDAGRVIGATAIVRTLTDFRRAELEQRFLANATRILASSLDYEEMLTKVTWLALPVFADAARLDMVDDRGGVRNLVVAHGDADQERAMDRLRAAFPDGLDLSVQIVRSGRPELVTTVTEAYLRRIARNDEHLALVSELGVASLIAVPLSTRGQTVGVMYWMRSAGGESYGSEDLALAEELAQRTAAVVENMRLYRAAQEANRLKDEFLATLSHELRTPLNAILGWVQMIRSGRLAGDQVTHALEAIERNASTQATIVSDILDISRIIRGKLRLNLGPLDVAGQMREALEAVGAAASSKGIRLEARIDPDAGTISADGGRLQQVLWNLLSNAIKFTPDGGRVELRVRRTDQQLEIAVADNGIGIHPGFIPYVFEHFRQEDASTTRSQAGLGLGLALVRYLVELHGGTVSAASNGEGHGATFTVRLPVRAMVFPALPVAREVVPQSIPALASRPLELSLEGLSVLFVDDDADARELIGTALGQCGARTRTAESAAQALLAFDEAVPDVLIADIAMPVVDGYALVREIRRRPLWQGGGVPAIAVTAFPGPEVELRALEAGFQRHLVKPVAVADLTRAIATAAGRAQSGLG